MFRTLLVSCLVALGLCSGTAFSQTTNASLSGTVTDSSGAVIPNALVTATDNVTGVITAGTTNGEGFYNIQELRPNPYTVVIKAPGFSDETVKDVVLLVGIARRLDANLKIGAHEDVTVTATQTQLLTENAALQDSVSERQSKELPLVVSSATAGRSPIAFLFLDSGVTGTTGNGTSLGNFRVNGNQGGSTDILIDGSSTRRAQNANFFSETAPGPNAFQEFTVTTSQYSAEYGASTGGVVNFAVKSGGQGYHGEAYDLLQNERLNANAYLNDLLKLHKPRDHQNNFGANIGGPIYIPHLYTRRDRAFFFFNYEGYRFNNGEVVPVTVPTAKMRTGDFSELLTDPYVLSQLGGPAQIYDPHVTGVGRPAIPGNRLDQYTSTATGKSVIDPAGLAILNLFPVPQKDGVFHNYIANSLVPVTSNSYTAKGDYNASDRQHLSISYAYRNQPRLNGGAPRFPEPIIANGVWNQLFISHYARLQHDFTITPHLLNHLNLGWNRAFVTNQNTTVGTKFISSNLGIPADATQNVAAPRIDFPGYGDYVTSADPRVAQAIGSTFFSDKQGDNTVDVGDVVGWSMGKHYLRMGADYRIQQLNVTQFIDPGGSFNFRADQTGLPNGNNGAVGGTGWPLASLITGATEFSFVTIHTAQPAYRFHYPAFFVNDDYKLNRKLTVNLGVRYEIPFARTEAHNFLRGFDPTVINPDIGIPGALVSAGAVSPKSRYRALAANTYSNVAPRIGFAYQLRDTLVVRGGWGIFYGPLQYNPDITAGTLGYSVARLTTPTADYSQSAAFLSTYPAAPQAIPSSQFIDPGCSPVARACTDVQYFNSPYRTGLVQQFSFNIQNELPKNFVFTIGYIGHLGQRLSSNFGRRNAIPFNDLPLGGPILNKQLSDVTAQDIAYATSIGAPIPSAPYTGFSGTVAQALHPFPQYGFVNSENETRGRDYYNALQAKLDHRFANGLQMGVSYTWSRLITNAADDIQGNSITSGNSGSSGGVVQYPNAVNLRKLRTVAPSDVPHSIVINYIYELPFGRNKAFLNHGGVVNVLVGGWQVNGVQRYQSDTPLIVSNGAGNLTNGFLNTIGVGGALLPNLTGAPLTVSGQHIDSGGNVRVLNPAAFAPTPTFNPGFAPTDTGNAAYAAYFSNINSLFGNAPTVLNVRPFPLYSEDISLLKKTTIHEGQSLELRVEGFNIFNRHSFAHPDQALQDGGNFGVAPVVGGGRIFQLGARFLF